MIPEVAEYWSLPLEQQMGIRKAFHVQVFGSGKSVYRIRGTVKIKRLEYCDCEYCEGHQAEETIVVDELIDAKSKEQALARLTDVEVAAMAFCEDMCLRDYQDDITWPDGPHITELPLLGIADTGFELIPH